MLAGSHRNAWPDETGTGGRTNRNTQHYPIALWNGIHGWAQTLYVRTLDVSLQHRIIAFAAQDMLRRYLLNEPVLGDYQTLQRSDSSFRP